MNSKTAKKIRQQFRRESADAVRDWTKMLNNNLKPKPSWVPWWIWMRGIRIFIKVK